jgi:RNA 3'-terminal phosphate cyclase (ATP)
MRRIRERRPRPGLSRDHVAAVQATGLCCSATVHGGFDGSPELRFQPGTLRGGDFRFEVATGGAATLLAQLVVPPLAAAGEPSRIAVTGATHVSGGPPYDFLARHWAALLGRLGLTVRFELVRAAFQRAAAGELRAEVGAWSRPHGLKLESRGSLLAVSGVSGAARLKGGVAERLRDAARARLWEAKRIEATWSIPSFPSASPGSFVLLEAVFEETRAAWCLLGEGGERPEALGDRVARRLLGFLDGEGAVDPHVAGQLAVPLALAGDGGSVSTDVVTDELEGVVDVVRRFGFPARCWGRRGGPGGVEVDRC